MKKIFEIEWDDELGEDWISRENLLSLIYSPVVVGGNIPLRVTDITAQSNRFACAILDDTCLACSENCPEAGSGGRA